VAKRYHVGAVIGEFPPEAETSFATILGRLRNDGQEEGAGLYLAADLGFPLITAAQFVGIKPDLQSGGAKHPQKICERPRRLRGHR
jgi:hypothetical protein